MRSLIVSSAFLLVACGSDPKPPPVTAESPKTQAPAPVESAHGAPPSAAAQPAAIATNDKMRAQALERVAMIARDVVAGWEREQLDADGRGTHHDVCPSARPLPAAIDRTRAVTVPDDAWMKDPGWNCLRFLPSEAHWFQYEVQREDDAHVKVLARRHDLELELVVSRASAKAEWTIGKVAERAH